jgi:aspartyl-tRNA(Asn)/glutamyl-tRNA(Gln) amidotransferase subunit C
MSVTPKDVEHVARLAELAVEPGELPALSAQLDRIVAFVAQLAERAPAPGPDRFVPGPEAAPLRDDVVRPARLARSPAQLAPEFIDGFFVVPRLGALEDEP